MDDRNKKVIAIGVGLAVIAIGCVVAMLVFMVLDPFGWFGVLLGGRDPIVRAMPEETDLYVGINLAQLLSSDAEAVVSTIIESVPGAEPQDLEDILGEIIDDLFYDYGMSFSSDISPWIGQHLGISIVNLNIDRYGDIAEPDMIIAIEVRDRDAADDFIADYIDAHEREWDEAFSRSEYRGIDFYELDGGVRTEAICRTGNTLILATSGFALESSIDALKGDSLAEDPDYRRISTRFPNRRFGTIYIGSGFAESYTNMMGIFGPGPAVTPMGFQALAITITFTDFGLQLDSFVSIEETALDGVQRGLMAGPGTGEDLIAMMPEDSIGFFVGQRLDLLWEGIEESMALAYGGDFNEAMLFFFEEFGIRPDIDLFPILDGDWAVVLLSGSTTSLGMDLGGMSLMLIAESSDGEEIEGIASDMAWGLEQSGWEMREIDVTRGTVYVAREDGDEYFSFGTQDGVLILGTDSEHLLATLEGTSSLEDDRTYRDVWNAFPRETTPVLYLDLNSLLEASIDFEDSDWEDIAWEIGINPRPYTHLAAGSGGFSQGSIRATFVIFVATE